jgi:probable HAF family extracellular repeat protein
MRTLILASTLLYASVASAQTGTFTITDLGTLDDGINYPYSAGLSLNENGTVAGIARVRSTILTHGFTWSSLTGMQDLGTFKVDGGLTAQSVNSFGEVAGTATDEMAVERAYRLINGNPQFVTPYRSNGYAINEAGIVVGDFTAGGPTRPFRFDPVTGFLDLGLPQGAVAATASAISTDGTIVGTSDSAKDRYFSKAFTWTQRDGFREVFPNSNAASVALAINNRGQVAGYQYSGSGWKAFITNPTGKTQYFSLKNQRVTAYGLNDLGVAVGDADGRAVILKGSSVIYLDSLIPPDSGWQLLIANDINNRGEIVGMGWIGAERHAFLLRPSN